MPEMRGTNRLGSDDLIVSASDQVGQWGRFHLIGLPARASSPWAQRPALTHDLPKPRINMAMMSWRSVNLALCLVVVSGLLIHGEDLKLQAPADTDAVAAWNRMIAAKGGRERLHRVQTFR